MSKVTSYFEKLRHPLWQKKRLEIMQRDEFHCQTCMNGESTLNVHHKRYVKGRDPWEYENHELITLCENCHESAHDLKHWYESVLACFSYDGPYSVREVLSLVCGFYSDRIPEELMVVHDFSIESLSEFKIGWLTSLLLRELGWRGVDRLVAMRLTERDINNITAFFCSQFFTLKATRYYPIPK